MHFLGNLHWSVIFQDLGIPIGLLVGFIKFVDMLVNLEAADLVGPATAKLILAPIYGGCIALIGYFWASGSSNDFNDSMQKTAISWWVPASSITSFLIILLLTLRETALVTYFFEPLPFSILIVVAAMALKSSKSNRIVALTNSLLFGAMLNTAVQVVFYFDANDNPDDLGYFVGCSCLALSYGLICYVCIYLSSYKFAQSEKINASRVTWHWLEISGFLIFMFLAPETMKANFANIRDNDAHNALESRVQELEKKLNIKDLTQNK
ncbi:hypothetical protein OAR36_08375 [Pseudomonadales bacterium]|nr:hypothetical protein [Pseudomonadales bacterium]